MMTNNAEHLYHALKTHDPRFDGKFFIGVRTTGIYCRPVCRVRLPLFKNCVFYSSAFQAEQDGFRPCLKCRPELAPVLQGESKLAYKTIQLIEEGRIEDNDIPSLAHALGVSDRHLRRVFLAELGVAPIKFIQTYRLLQAKQMLTDTSLSVTDIAMIAGFKSLRRFNEAFKNSYRLTPSELRKSRMEETPTDFLQFSLSYLPPYLWENILGFFAGRSIFGVECVDNETLRRSCQVFNKGKNYAGWFEVKHAPEKRSLLVRIPLPLAQVSAQILSRVRHMFDLHSDPTEIAERLGSIEDYQAGLRVPGCFDGFELAVRAIIGQQISVKGARTLLGKIAQALGDQVATPWPEINRCFPAASKVADMRPEQIAEIGIVSSRARAIVHIAREVRDGKLNLSPSANVEETIKQLVAIPGIGPWTAKYIAMRALAWPDSFLDTDYAIKKILPKQKLASGVPEWQPWRSYAVMHLWGTL